MSGPPQSSPRTIGRYLLAGPIASGGMATVHLGKLNGPAGFRKTVAIKRMLQAWAGNSEARTMLIDEARLTSRVSHANVVQTQDVVEHDGELFLILEYVHGESLDRLLLRCKERGVRPPVPVAIAILAGVLRGLHAAHEARSEDGQPLELVHRDLSPHNILVDVHGVARVLDFGVARARGRLQATQDGQLKGKLSYLAPEQVHGAASRRSDLFTAGVVLWECLAGRQLFEGTSEAELLSKVLLCKVPRLSEVGVDQPGLQAILDRALEREPERRFATAAELAEALEAQGPASAAEVAAWVSDFAAQSLAERTRLLEQLDRQSLTPAPAPVVPGPVAARRPLWPLAVGGVALLGLWAAWTRPAPAPAAPVAEVIRAPETLPMEPARPSVAPPPAELRPAPSPRIPVSPPLAAPAVVKACNPPFVIDAAGVKRFKPECLH